MTTSPRPRQHSSHTHIVGPHTRYTKHAASGQAVLLCSLCLYVSLVNVFSVFDLRRPPDIMPTSSRKASCTKRKILLAIVNNKKKKLPTIAKKHTHKTPGGNPHAKLPPSTSLPKKYFKEDTKQN